MHAVRIESGLHILEVFYDASGDDGDNLNEELVTILNDGENTADPLRLA